MVSTPFATPCTSPVAETVAMPTNTLLQVPPTVASAKVKSAPIQSEVAPDIGNTEGNGLAVIAWVVLTEPHEFE